MIKALLEELDIEFRSLGSTTYKTRQCFKSQINVSTFKMSLFVVKKRLDLTVDPPDLALEIDVTSRTIQIFIKLWGS